MAVAVERPSRLQELERSAARMQAERDTIGPRLAQLKAQELELRRANYRDGDSSQRSDAGGARSPVYRIVKEQRDLEASIPALDAELAVVADELRALREEVAQAEFEQIVDELQRFDGFEREIIASMREAREAFMLAFEEYRALHATKRMIPAKVTVADQGRFNQIRDMAKRCVWDPAPSSPFEAFDRLTKQADLEAEGTPRIVVSRNDHAEPPTLEQKADHYSLVNRLRNEGVTDQPLPAYPELQDPSFFRGQAQRAAGSLPPQEPGEQQVESVDASMNAVGRRLFRGKQDS